MVRIRQARGGWKDLDPTNPPPERFQRSDGSHMTEEEITAIGRVDAGVFVKKDGNAPVHKGRVLTDQELVTAWDLAKQMGRADAAKTLGLPEGTLHSRLLVAKKRLYPDRLLPGILSSEERRVRRAAGQAASVASRKANVQKREARQKAVQAERAATARPASDQQAPELDVERKAILDRLIEASDRINEIVAEPDPEPIVYGEVSGPVELTERQAELVLESLEGHYLNDALRALRDHGFDFVVRLRSGL